MDWSLIEAIAKTRAVDLWILFPLGVAVNRLLTKAELPPEKWAQALTRILGTEGWRDAFYSREVESTLFGDEEVRTKEADFGKIGRYFVERLKTIFTAVANNPLPLRNSRNVPLYLLCFAAGNPRAGIDSIENCAEYLESLNDGRAFTYRMDSSDVESRHRLHEGQRRMQELLRRATRIAAASDG